MATEIMLQCWVSGQDVARIFPVQISSTRVVGELKEAIKKEKIATFRDVDANSLNLYSIPSPDDADLEATLTQWSPTGATRLSEQHKLSKYFPPGSDQEPFIIIEGPSIVPDMTLNCWVRGTAPNAAFPVEIAARATVGALKEAIKKENPVKFRDVDANTLALYKVSLPWDDSIKKTLKNLDLGQAVILKPLDTLIESFPGTLLHNYIHLVVTADASLPGKSTPPLPAEEDDMLAPLIHSFKIATTITSVTLTPSQAAKPNGYIKTQSGDQKILDCRCAKAKPVNTVAPPIQLFHPAFAFFSSKASDPAYHVPHEVVRDIWDLIAQFSLVRDIKENRLSHIRLFFEKVIGRPLTSVNDQDSPDFTVIGKCGRLRTCLVVGELGGRGLDPSTQAAFSYQRIFYQEQNTELCLRCCCPAFAFANAGPWLTIMGCIITGNCVVQRLTDFLWIPVHSSHDNSQFFKIARVFYALRESIELLDSWYENTVKNIPPFDESSCHVPHPRFFPSPNAYRDGDDLVRFAYQTPLEFNVSCATYRAKTLGDNPREIVIKFVTSYGADAHRYMGSAGFAPQLLYYGQIDVDPDMPSYGDLRMVVMEYVKGLAPNKVYQQGKIPRSFESDLCAAVQHLHGADYVFGDLRPPNVMITSEDKVKLIDFDWAGKHGEVKYPVAISSSIPWPKGVQGLALIRKEHDEVMLRAHLMAFCSAVAT